MIDGANSNSKRCSSLQDDEPQNNSQDQSQQQQHLTNQNSHKQPLQYSSSSSSSLTSGIGQSDLSICNDRVMSSNNVADIEFFNLESRSQPISSLSCDVKGIDEKVRVGIKQFVDSIFTDSESISLEKKAEFGELVKNPQARLLFAMFVDEYRVNSKRVSELTFYSLVQYFSIVLLECLLAEDFRPAKIIMNMMFTYYYEQNCDNIPPQDRPIIERKDQNLAGNMVKTYLYTLLKDQEIFKSIRFWTSAFYESVMIERKNHPVFSFNREQGKSNNERRNEELDCSKNITFGLLGSFIYNMSLLELSHEFCQEFLDKHSTIAGLSEEQLEMLRGNLESMFNETSVTSAISASRGDRLAAFLHKLSTKLNQTNR